MTIKKGMFFFLSAVLLLAACSKKDLSKDSSGTGTDTTTQTTSSATNLLLDSIFLYAKQTYLWYDQLPDSATFLPRSYNTGSGTDSAKATNEIFALTRYAINPATGKSYEYYDYDGDTSYTKYSFIESHDADQNNSSSYKSYVTLAGWGNDLGFYGPVFVEDSVFCFSMIYENSPAYNAGLRRGSCYVYKVNGSKFSYYSSTDISMLNSALNASSISLSYYDSTGVSHDVQLQQTRYASNPILKDTVWTVNSKKIGYLALLNFASQDILYSKLKNAFSDFSSKGITDIIVDLRYNGGGYVNTSVQLANLIAPSSLSGQKMFYEHYNTLMQNGQATILKNQPIEGEPQYSYYDYSWTEANNTTDFADSATGNLNISNVCFIVSDATASASELLINNLKPYMNVKLIGATLTGTSSDLPETIKTYGKPVGFFAINIGNYDVYLSQFESRNSLNTAVPYDGMTTDITDWDDISHDLGNSKEDATAQAINYITSGAFLTTTQYMGEKSNLRSSSTTLASVLLSATRGTGSGSNSLRFRALKKLGTRKGIDVRKGMIQTFRKTVR